jgi:hypothetical protein
MTRTHPETLPLPILATGTGTASAVRERDRNRVAALPGPYPHKRRNPNMKAVTLITAREAAQRTASLPLALTFSVAAAMVSSGTDWKAVLSGVESMVSELAERYGGEGMKADQKAAVRALRHVRRAAKHPADPYDADLIAVLEFITQHGLAGDVAGIACAHVAQPRPSASA